MHVQMDAMLIVNIKHPGAISNSTKSGSPPDGGGYDRHVKSGNPVYVATPKDLHPGILDDWRSRRESALMSDALTYSHTISKDSRKPETAALDLMAQRTHLNLYP